MHTSNQSADAKRARTAQSASHRCQQPIDRPTVVRSPRSVRSGASRLDAVDAYLIDAVRTPFGKHRGGLAGIRTDDLAALPIIELMKRHAGLDAGRLDDVILGDTNGAGEDNRNVARMAVLLAGLPDTVPGVTVNRLCGSGGEAIIQAARAVRAGDASLMIAGGVESMTRAPFVIPKPDVAQPADDAALPDAGRLAHREPEILGPADGVARRLRRGGRGRTRHLAGGAGRVGVALARAGRGRRSTRACTTGTCSRSSR